MSYGWQKLPKECYRAFALASLLCSVILAQAIKSSYLPGTDFSKFRTYKWVEVKGRQHPDPSKDAQIKQLVDHQLTAKGLTKTDDTADLSIDYQVAVAKSE